MSAPIWPGAVTGAITEEFTQPLDTPLRSAWMATSKLLLLELIGTSVLGLALAEEKSLQRDQLEPWL